MIQLGMQRDNYDCSTAVLEYTQKTQMDQSTFIGKFELQNFLLKWLSKDGWNRDRNLNYTSWNDHMTVELGCWLNAFTMFTVKSTMIRDDYMVKLHKHTGS